MDSTSETLLERVRRPNEHEAWERFVRIYSPLLVFWARRAGFDDVDRADLVQDILLDLLKEIPKFRYDAERGRFRSWLKTFVVNRARARWRGRRSASPVGAENDMDELMDAPLDGNFWDQEYRDQLVQYALSVMKTEFEPKTWKACWEHVVSGRPAIEIAQELGLSVASV